MPYGFGLGDIPGANSTFVNTANNLLATLGGLIATGGQYFNVTSRTSGFVPGAPSIQNQKFDQYAFYAQDSIKLRRGLNLTLGLRWDYMQPVDETNGFSIMPRLIDNNPITTLLGNAQLDFAGTTAGRPYHKKDFNNFAPNIALVWDPTGSGKTSIRAGFNLAYLNDNTLNSIYNSTYINNGLNSARQITNLNARADAPPTIPAPPFGIPTTSRDQFLLSPTSPPVEGLVDPNLATPYSQQWIFSIQREIPKGFVVEGRYVGNHIVKQYRNIDVNQININQAGYLDDFIKARNNGFLSQNAGRGFNATYNPDIAGSQPLPFFAKMPNGGSLTNASYAALLRSGEAAELAKTYQGAGILPNIPGFSFFPNPYLLYASLMTNISNSSYNGLQLEIRKRTRSGFQFQANYTFSKALTDSDGLRGLDAQLDNASPRVERSRADFDQTHAFKVNHFVPLPLGNGHRISTSNRFAQRLIDGWGVSGFLSVYSGSPVSVLSARGTLNRLGRAAWNTVDSTADLSKLKEMTGLFMTGNGPYWLNPSAINPDTTTGVAADGASPFAGQLFFNPQPGKLGSLQRRLLDGPGYWNYNMALVKSTKIRERHLLELHADFFNVFNHPNFYLGDQNVNSASFGKIGSQNVSNDGVGPRVMQFGLYYRF